MKSVVAEMPVKLLLVLEIEPWTYSKRRAPEGPGGAPVDASEWDAHFRQCMADAGFAGVEPIRVGSHHVEARTLAGTPLLERIVRQKLERSGIAGFPDADGQIAEPRERILALSGGYALCSAGVALIEPRCCGDLDDLDGWQEAMAGAPAEAEIWIGHPALGARFHEDAVTLTEHWDHPPAPESLLQITMPIVWLAGAVEAAAIERERFRDELLATVCALIPDERLAGTVADVLSGVPAAGVWTHREA